MTEKELTLTPNQPLEYVGYAGFWRRAAAMIADQAIFGILALFVQLIVIVVGLAFAKLLLGSYALFAMTAPTWLVNLSVFGVVLIVCLPFILIFLFYVKLESSAKYMATPGKMLMKIKVLNTYGEKEGSWQAFWRNVGKILSALIFCLGYVMAAFTPKKQALHDKMAGSIVVVTEKTGFWRGLIVAVVSYGIFLGVQAVLLFVQMALVTSFTGPKDTTMEPEALPRIYLEDNTGIDGPAIN